MSNATIEQRLARVEELLSAVLIKLESPSRRNSSESLASLSDVPDLSELFDPALAVRERDREIARKRFAHEKFLPDNSLKGNWTDSIGMFGNDVTLKEQVRRSGQRAGPVPG